MSRYTKRLLTALIVSSSCFYGTVYWYNSQLKEGRSHNKAPIALLKDHTNEVQRKPLARVIWESVSNGENLYAGEAIRTTGEAEAKILFLKTNTIIELEPESLVVLEASENGIALDFLKGNLFVKNEGGGTSRSPGSAITLKTGDQKIALNNADMSLSKNNKGAVDLEIFKGTAQLESGGKSVTLDTSKSGMITEDGLTQSQSLFKIIYPLPGDVLYISQNKNATASFQWEKLAPGYTVYLEMGSSRSSMKRVEGISALGEKGEIIAPAQPGRHYWRLVAEPTDPEKSIENSNIYPTQIVAKIPPVLIEPQKDSHIALERKNPKLKIKWVNRMELESLAVEMAKDPQLKEKVIQQYLDSKVNFAEVEIKESGTFYWRITGFMKIKNKMEPVASDVQKFTAQIGIDLVPPDLRSPLKGQTLSFNQISESGLFLSWDPVPGIDKYKVEVRKLAEGPSEPIQHTVPQSPLRLTDMRPGKYQWFVSSISAEGKPSMPSETREFMVDEMPKLQWTGGPDPAEYLYFTAKPSFSIGWQRGPESVTSYRVRFALSGQLNDETPWHNVNKLSYEGLVTEDGDYQFEVEGLSAKGRTVARSSHKILSVRAKPLLPAPRFTDNLPEKLEANRRGLLELAWEPVEGAAKYKVQLVDLKGEVAQERVIDRTTASISKLKPGQYKVSVKAIDEHERPGHSGQAKDVSVPNLSNIQAPKVKAIKVK